MSWQDEADCKGMDASLFFPEPGRNQAPIVRVCAACPVRKQCLQHALDNDELGIWGGTSERERERMRRGTRPLGRRVIEFVAHGDIAGYQRHIRLFDPPCDACRIARNAYESDRRRELKISAHAKCGTIDGYLWHLQNGGEGCRPCRLAWGCEGA